MFLVVIWMKTSSLLFPLKGIFPQSIMNDITPAAQISTPVSYGYLLMISGAMYNGDPKSSVKPPSEGS